MRPAPRHGFQSRYWLGAPRRLVSAAAAFLMVATLATVGGAAVSNAAPPTSLTVTKEADARVLIGEDISYTITATNPNSDAQGDRVYNLSFRDVLPAGVTYKVGSSALASGGALPDPTIVTVKSGGTATGEHVLIWTNVSDLPGGASQAITFKATPDPIAHPVGDEVTNSASAYANSDARYVPKFDTKADDDVDGTVISVPDGSNNKSYTASGATLTPTTTQITAIKIEKSEDSPEHELMRGAHDQHGIYTLTVTNNGVNPTNDVEVVDYLPAGLEFLQCGGIDNSAAGEYEYDTRRLTDNSGTVDAADCVNPYSVETVSLASGNAQGLDAGVYTKVIWKASAPLAAHATWVIKYVAAIPQQKNAPFSEPAPDVICSEVSSTWTCPQAANLDNNTGLSTREPNSSAGTEDGEKGLTNVAQASGKYQGPGVGGVAAPIAVTDDDSLTVTAEDIAIQKSVDTDANTAGAQSKFEQGKIATYTLSVEVSEYVDAKGIIITDVIPDGLCPTADSSSYTCLISSGSANSTQISSYEAKVTGANGITSITHNATDGTYKLVFAALKSDDTKRNETVTIKYPVLMRDKYDSHSTAPTVSGDDYTNHVSLVGTTTTRSDIEAPESDYGSSGENAVLNAVGDTSEATITSDVPTLKKTILPNGVTGGAYKCDATTPAYTDNDVANGGIDADQIQFHIGDRVCFNIRVDFSAANDTKNPVLTDFLPPFVEYESGSDVAAGDNSITDVQLDATHAAPGDGGMLTWTIGAGSVGAKFVDKANHIFERRVSAIVKMLPSMTDQPDVKGNLAKLTWTNTDNVVSFTRDEVNFTVINPMPSIAKTHTEAGPFVGGDSVHYTITVTNNDISAITAVQVKDELPDGIKCAQISDIASTTPAGTCVDDGGTGPSVISWAITSIAVTNHQDLTYTMTIPDNPRVLTAYKNYTGVVQYTSELNHNSDDSDKDTEVHHPNNNRNTLKDCGDSPSPSCDLLPIQADDTVNIRNTGLTKDQSTGLDETNNNAASQAVIGETITYTVKATVPAKTTVYQGLVSDPMPTGIELLSATAKRDSTALNVDSATSLDGGANSVTLTVTPGVASAGKVELALGGTYTNSTSTDQVFEITINARVTQDSGNAHGTERTNTATFVRKNASTGSGGPSNQTAQTKATIVVPAPTISKADNRSGVVTAGQEVQYTLTVGNTTGRPTLYDVTVVDCLPAGLTWKSFDSPNTNVAQVGGDGSNGCATGETKLTWTDLSDLVAGAAATVLTYTATVDTSAAGGQTYKNSAEVRGNDLDNDTQSNGTADIGRIYTANTDHTVTVKGADLVKSVSPTTATIGDTVTYTVTVTLPKDVNFYSAVIHDTLPAGIALGDVSDDTCTLEGSTCTTAGRQTADGQNIGWSLGDLASAASDRTLVITYKATVVDTTVGGVTSPVAGGTLVNSAYFGWNATSSGSPAGPDTTPNQKTTDGTATVTVVEPLLTIAKQVKTTGSYAGSVSADAGDTVTYQVTVTNGSGTNVSEAHAITVTDVVPAGITVKATSITGSGSYDLSTRTITWTVTSLAKGAQVDLTYDATVNSATGTKTNTATVDSYCSVAVASTETCAGNGGREYTGPSDTAVVTGLLPHVVVAKAVTGGDIAYVGESKGFTITITSDGDAAALNVAAVDTLPANWAYDADSAMVSVKGATATQVNPTTVVGQVLTWTGLGDLPDKSDAGNKTIVITYTATPGTAALTTPGVGHDASHKHTNTVAVTAEDALGHTGADDGNGGTAPYNGPDAEATVYLDSADVQIIKTAPVPWPDKEASQTNGTWEIEVKNLGPDTSVGPFTVKDSSALPAGFSVTGVTGINWTCTDNSNATTLDFVCDRTTTTDTLAKDASFETITVSYAVDFAVAAANATWTNTATVEGMKTYDPHDKTHGAPADNNNTSTATMGLKYADLKITKVHAGADDFRAGNDIHYTITVTNLGKDTATKPEVTDTLPDVFDDTSVALTFDANDWAPCTVSGRDVTCTAKNDLAKDATISFVVTATLKTDYHRTSVVNEATVSSTTPDPVPSNNKATDRWDPPPPPVVSPSTSPTPTPTSPVTTTPAPTTTTVPPTTPTVPTIIPSSATSVSTPPPPTNVPSTSITVSPNQCTDLVEHGFVPGETVTITVTGSSGQYELTAVADANGDVAFCLQAEKPETITIEVLGEHHVVVREVVIGVEGLGYTGVPTVKYLTFALLLLGAGVALTLISRRGRRGRHFAK